LNEDRLIFHYRNKEKEGIIYYLNDLLLICSKIDKSDFEFKFKVAVELN